MSIHIDDVFMEGRPEKSEKIKGMINTKFKIQESGKVKKFVIVKYEWGRDAICPYAKMNMEKDVKKLVDGYDNFTGRYIKVQKTPVATIMTISKSETEETKDIDKYR